MHTGRGKHMRTNTSGFGERISEQLRGHRSVAADQHARQDHGELARYRDLGAAIAETFGHLSPAHERREEIALR